MMADNIDLFIEIGPGKTLSSFIKKVDRKANVFNVEDISSLDKVLKSINI